MGFGNWLRSERIARGLSKRKVAAVAGVDRHAWARWESGTSTPEDYQAAAIGRALGVEAATVTTAMEAT